MLNLTASILILAQIHLPAVPALTIKPATATLSENFKRVQAVRELSDGRLLIADDLGDRVVVADSGLLKVTPPDGAISGQQINALRALGGDSSLGLNHFSTSWYLFVGSRFVGNLQLQPLSELTVGSSPISTPGSRGMAVRMPPKITYLNADSGVDQTAEHIASDSTILVRLPPRSSRIDTVAQLQVRYGGPRVFRVVPLPAPPASTTARYDIQMISRDFPIMFPDVWIAIARADPYRIDWCETGKACAQGPLLPEQPEKASQADMETYLNYSVKSSGRAEDY